MGMCEYIVVKMVKLSKYDVVDKMGIDEMGINPLWCLLSQVNFKTGQLYFHGFVQAKIKDGH